jgi:hypothetical protein
MSFPQFYDNNDFHGRHSPFKIHYSQFNSPSSPRNPLSPPRMMLSTTSLKKQIPSSKIQYVILFSVISTTIFSQNQDPNSYFPPKSKNWEKAQVSESNWNEDALRKAINYTESQNSTGLLVLYKGEILVEEYWAGKEALLLNDIASMQKSIVSLLCGVAI